MASTTDKINELQMLLNNTNTNKINSDFMIVQFNSYKLPEMVYEDIEMPTVRTGKHILMSRPRIPCRCKLDKYCKHCG